MSEASLRRRRPDWRTRLHAELTASQTLPFEWGANDCALFAMRCVEAMTGDDPAAPFISKYKTAIGAAGVIKRAGYNDLAEFAAAYFAPIHTSLANTGDLAAVSTDTGVALGIFSRDRIHVMRQDGLGTVSRSEAIAAFRV